MADLKVIDAVHSKLLIMHKLYFPDDNLSVYFNRIKDFINMLDVNLSLDDINNEQWVEYLSAFREQAKKERKGVR